jgi:hypothetical protein
MTIQYLAPLQDAIQRTRGLLFGPFDLARWLALGLTAWLIHLGQAGGSAAGSDPDIQTQVRTGDLSGALDSLSSGLVQAIPTGAAALLLLTVGVGIVLVMIALLWVGSRMRFVWLENLTAGDHAITPHWRRFGGLGDQFFVWKLVFYALILALVLPLAFFAGLFGALAGHGWTAPGSILGWMLLGMAVLTVGLVAAYVDYYAESFVTVIMHRRDLGVIAAWREFQRLFQAQPLPFLLVGIMKLGLRIVAGLAVALVGVLTCCIGWVVLSLPYVGTVLQLPIYVALRYFDLCWLGQFAGDLGPERAITPPPPPLLDDGTGDRGNGGLDDGPDGGPVGTAEDQEGRADGRGDDGHDDDEPPGANPGEPRPGSGPTP